MVEEDKIKIYKYCFECWKDNNYNKAIFRELSDRLGIEREIVRKYIKKYILDYSEFSDIKQQELMEFMACKDFTLTLYNRLNIMVEGTTKEERKRFINQYCYNFCKSVNWDSSKMQPIEYLLGITSKKVREYARNHMIDNGIDLQEITVSIEENKKEKTKNIGQKIHRNVILEKISEEDDEQKIIEIIEQSGFNPQYLKYSVTDYVTLYRNSLKDSLITELKNKINTYIKYKNRLKAEEREKQVKEDLLKKREEELSLLSEARKIVNTFIDGEYNAINDFIKSVNIDIKTFRCYVNLLKKYDVELYQKYHNRGNEIRNKKFIYMVNIVKNICFLLRNGVEENCEIRSFDLLDYYNITKLNLQEMLDFINFNKDKISISNSDFRLFKTFIKKNSVFEEYGNVKINRFINSIISVGYKNDDGNTVSRIITKEELEAIVNYLNINSIPINEKTLYLVRHRYVNGIIRLPSTKSKKRIRDNH